MYHEEVRRILKRWLFVVVTADKSPINPCAVVAAVVKSDAEKTLIPYCLDWLP